MSQSVWRKLIACSDEIRANLIVAALHAKDIPAISHSQKDSAYVMLGAVYVLVPEDHLENSRKILIEESMVEENAFEGE